MVPWLPSQITGFGSYPSHTALPAHSTTVLESEALLVTSALESLAGFHMAQQTTAAAITPGQAEVKDKQLIDGLTALGQGSTDNTTRGQSSQSPTSTSLAIGKQEISEPVEKPESRVVLSWTPLTQHKGEHVTMETEKSSANHITEPAGINIEEEAVSNKQEINRDLSSHTEDELPQIVNCNSDGDDDNEDDLPCRDDDDVLSVGFEMDTDNDFSEENDSIVCIVNKVVSGLESTPIVNEKEIKQEKSTVSQDVKVTPNVRVTPNVEVTPNVKATPNVKIKVEGTRKSRKSATPTKSTSEKPTSGRLLRSRRKSVPVHLKKEVCSDAEIEVSGKESEEIEGIEQKEDVHSSDTEEYINNVSPSKELHSNGEKINCRFCDKNFRNRSNLCRHERRNHLLEKRECGRCGLVLKIKDMKKHMIKVHKYREKPKRQPTDKALLTCTICNEQMNTTYSLRRHMKTHDPGERFSCEVCNKSFCRKDVLKEHMFKHSGERPFTCRVCNKSFFSVSILKGHEKIHADVKDYLCLVCGKSFVQKSKLGRHMKNRHDERQYKCDQCKRKFHSENEVKDHPCPGAVQDLDKNTNDEFPCTICNKVFQKRRNMLIHRRLHNDSQPRHQCTICLRVFRDRCNLTKHTRFVHSNIRNYVCDICGKSFKQNDTLKTHYRVHSSEKCKDFKCDECDKYFSGNTALTVHKRSHSGAKPFMCDICGMAFRQSGNMSKHMLIHTNLKFYKCEICGNEYKYQETWKAHMRGHAIKEGLSQDAVSTKYGKVYNCEHCGKKISTASQYKVHLRTHTNERPYPCHLCEKAFKEKGKLSRHIKKVHLSNHGDEITQPILESMTVKKSYHRPVQKLENPIPHSSETIHPVTAKKEDQLSQPVIHAINVDSQMFKTYINLQSEPIVYYNMG